MNLKNCITSCILLNCQSICDQSYSNIDLSHKHLTVDLTIPCMICAPYKWTYKQYNEEQYRSAHWFSNIIILKFVWHSLLV